MNILKRSAKGLSVALVVVLVANILLGSWATTSLPTRYRKELSAQGWQMEDLDPLRGGYSVGLVSSRAHMTYRSRRKDRSGELYIELERRSPFGPWTLSEFRQSKPVEEGK